MESPTTPPRRSSRAVARVPPSPRFSAYNGLHPMTRRSPSPSVSPRRPKQRQPQSGDSSAASSSGTMLPTPSETPALSPAQKRQRAASMKDSARILRFQPNDPNDVMPSPREARKFKHTSNNNMGDSGLDITRSQKSAKHEVPVYVEPSARMPEVDTSADNMFYDSSPKRLTAERPPIAHTEEERLAQWNASPSPPPVKKTEDQILEEERLQAAVDRGDGVFYVFRGKKVYRKFEGETFTDDPSASSRTQRQLRRAAGTSAARPVTRSEIQPRRLWAPQASEASRTSLSDEEAETDVEMTDECDDATDSQQYDSGVSFNASAVHATPVKKGKSSLKPMLSPPTTSRTTRQSQLSDVPSFEDTLDADEVAAADSVLPTPQSSRKKQVSIHDIPIYEDEAPESLDHLTPARRRSKRGPLQLMPVVEDSDEPNSADPPSPAQLAKQKKRNNGSPFDQWPRTKAGAKRSSSKRDSDAADSSPNGAPAKRSRSATRSNAGQA